MTPTEIIALIVAVSLGLLNVIIKVNEKMSLRRTNSKPTVSLPCKEHSDRIAEGKVVSEQIRRDFHAICLIFTERVTRLETQTAANNTLLGSISAKLDNLHKDGGE